MLKIIISPAKKMNTTDDYPCALTTPAFLDRALELHARLKEMSLSELKNLWGCSDRLAEQNYERLSTYSPDQALTPALLSYEGLQYQHISPSVFTNSQWNYAVSHLRILSGFYGLLSPTDKVIPYRLEMQAGLRTERGNNLYSYWGDSLYRRLIEEGSTELVNLASGEYSKSILPYISQDIERPVSCVTCVFGEMKSGKVKMKGTQAKIARGEMVRWMSENEIEKVQDIREFKESGYSFCPELSQEDKYVFLLSGTDSTSRP